MSGIRLKFNSLKGVNILIRGIDIEYKPEIKNKIKPLWTEENLL